MAQSNMRQQFLQSILGSGKFGKKKHEYKIGTEDGGSGYLPKLPWVFSDNHKHGLKSFSSQMARFMRENYPAIKLASKIRARHWNELFEIKAVVCSTKTLELYRSYVKKLEICVEKHFKLKYPLNWTKGLILPESIKTPSGELLRVQQMSRRDYAKIMGYAQRAGAWSRAPVAWELSARFGLRVAEAADIRADNVHLDECGKWGRGYIDIWGKGKRYRKIDIRTKEDRDYIIKTTVNKNPETKIVGLKKDAINAQLERVMKTLKLKSKYPVTGVHSIRKLYSQETFRWVQQEKKMTEKEAAKYVNNQLGHSEERDEDLLAINVKDVKRKIEKRKSLKYKHKITESVNKKTCIV